MISLGLLSLPTWPTFSFFSGTIAVNSRLEFRGTQKVQRFKDLVTGFWVFTETTEQQINRENDRNARVSSCTLSKLLVIALNSDWFIALFATAEISRRNFFNIDFLTVIRKPLETIWHQVLVSCLPPSNVFYLPFHLLSRAPFPCSPLLDSQIIKILSVGSSGVSIHAYGLAMYLYVSKFYDFSILNFL